MEIPLSEIRWNKDDFDQGSVVCVLWEDDSRSADLLVVGAGCSIWKYCPQSKRTIKRVHAHRHNT